jgi:hypothetical protein
MHSHHYINSVEINTLTLINSVQINTPTLIIIILINILTLTLISMSILPLAKSHMKVMSNKQKQAHILPRN